MSSRFHLGGLVALLLAAALVLAGCANTAPASQATPAKTGAFPMTLTDDAGRSLTIDKAPQRFLSLSSSNTELLYALGLQDKLVGVDDFSDYPAEAKTKEKVGGFSKPNLEKIVSLSPDLILATNIHVKSVVPELEKRNLKVMVIQPAKLDNVPENLQLLGKIGGKPEAAEKVVADMKTRIENVTTKRREPEAGRYWDANAVDLPFPGGESVAMLAKRTQRFLDDVSKAPAGATVLVVSHGGPLKMLICQSLGLRRAQWWQLKMDLGSLSILDLYPEGAVLSRLNDVSHL